jgi:hypothetical protein
MTANPSPGRHTRQAKTKISRKALQILDLAYIT